MPEPLYVPRDHPAIKTRGLSWRQVKRLQDERKLSIIKPNGRQSTPLVDLRELDDLLALGTVPATEGLLVDVPARLLASIDALAARYDGRPGTDVHRLLCAIVERIDVAIWE